MGIKKEEDGSGTKPVGEDGAVDYKYVFTTRSRKLRDVFTDRRGNESVFRPGFYG